MAPQAATADATTDPERRASLELDISGMTCASCAARIEKKLNKVDGVTASVNYATEKAKILAPTTLSLDDLIGVVEKTGYGAKRPDPATPAPDRVAPLRRDLMLSAALAVPVIALAMIPALQFPGWQWVSFALTTPVILWGGWPFHRATFANARHGAMTMDTLITLGTGAAYLWSVWALLFGTAGRIGMTMKRVSAVESQTRMRWLSGSVTPKSAMVPRGSITALAR